MNENQEVFDQKEEAEQNRVPVFDDELIPESEDDYNDNKNRQSNSNYKLTNSSNGESDSGPGSRLRYEVSSDLGEYWDLDNGTVITPAADLVLSMITDYSNLTASPTTPQ